MRKSTFAIAVAATLYAASNAAVVYAQQAGTSSTYASSAVSTSAAYSRSMEELKGAAQRLRESIQSLAQREPGPERDTALKAAQEALYDTQQAMVRLPPELRTTSPAAKGVAPGYAESMTHLRQAADRLYDAIHAMAKQPAGPRRNDAMQEARAALMETQTAMVWLPNASGTAAMPKAASLNVPRGSVASGAGAGMVGGGWGITAGSDAAPVGGNAQAVAGGVGLNARAVLSSEAAPDHNVKLVFSLSSGNYLADVDLKVTDSAGRTVIDGVSDGPWLYAKLPAGTYTASATYRGQTVTERFTVGMRGQRTAHLRWPASVEHQAVAGASIAPILGTGLQEPDRQ